MPGGYRPRAVKRVPGQRKLKMNAPTVKFTLTKHYELSKGQAHSTVYMKGIKMSTPFQPIFDVDNNSAQPLGNWDPNDEVNEPIGLNSALYTHYNNLVVKSCHVTASVTQAPDVQTESTEVLTTGEITLARTANELDTVAEIPTSKQIKGWFGRKTKNFQLAPAGAISPLTKSAFVSNGYSAKKQFNANANTKEDLVVVNASGSANQAQDNTYMYVIIKPRKDLVADGTAYLMPMMVTLRISYIVQFQDPDRLQSVPLPISTGSNAAGNKKRYNSKQLYRKSDLYNQASAASAAVAALAALGYGARRAGGRNRVPLIGMRGYPPFVQ